MDWTDTRCGTGAGDGDRDGEDDAERGKLGCLRAGVERPLEFDAPCEGEDRLDEGCFEDAVVGDLGLGGGDDDRAGDDGDRERERGGDRRRGEEGDREVEREGDLRRGAGDREGENEETEE